MVLLPITICPIIIVKGVPAETMIMPNDNHIVVHSLLDLRDLSGLVQVSLFLNDELLLFDCQLQKSEFTIL